MIINLDQTPLFYISAEKYIFNIKSAKNVPVKGIDDKRQITATFEVSTVGDFLPMQPISTGNTKICLPNFDFPFFQKTKRKHCDPKKQMSLVIMDTFKSQDREVLKEFCAKTFRELLILPHNLINKFQPLDISVSKADKFFISEKYNT